MSDNENNTFALPEGRLIHGHLFVRSVYKDENGREGDPKYSVELAFPQPAKDEIGGVLKDFEDHIYNTLVASFGAEKVEQYEKANQIRWPIKDGNEKAARREALNKPGDAYLGHDTISASTLFNKDGDVAEGGIDVFNENVENIAPVNKSKVWNGCMGVAAVKAKAYEGTDRSGPFMSCVLYLEAFQKTGDGERLSTPTDRSGLFQKRTGSESSAPASSGRRRTRS